MKYITGMQSKKANSEDSVRLNKKERDFKSTQRTMITVEGVI